MTRPADTILQRGYGKFTDSPMVDIAKSGQNGPMPNVGAFVGNAAYIRKNVIALLLEAPSGFQYLENPETYVATLRSLVEEQAQSIQGLNSMYEVSFEETPVGGAGEMQEDPSNVTRTRSNPSFTWVEKYGMPISKFLTAWIDQLVMDPATKFASVVSQDGRPRDLLPDFYTMTVLFFEPDPTFQYVNKAWLCANMAPKTNGDAWQGSRDLTQPGQRSELQIDFTTMTQVGYGVNRLAQKLLNRMNRAGMNPHLHKAFMNDTTADVAASGNGYADSLDKRARDRIRIG
jgi:hypothetical protein